MFLLRDRIAMAVGLVKEAAAAVTGLPLLMLFPLATTIVMAFFTLVFVTYSV